MAVSVLDAANFTTGSYQTSFTVSAGSNRWAFVFITNGSGSDAAPPSSVSLGGQVATYQYNADDTSWDVTCTLALWNEAAIAAMSGSTLTITGGSFDAGRVATLVGSVQDSSQTEPAVAFAATVGTSGGVSLSRVADGYTFGVTVQDVLNSFSSTANPSIIAQAEIAVSNTTAWGGEVSTLETVNYTWANAFSRDNATIAVNFAPGAAGPVITLVTDPIIGTISVTVDTTVTATDIEITAEGVTDTFAVDSPGSGTSFTATVDRDTSLPFSSASASVRLMNGVTEVATTTTTLGAPVGTAVTLGTIDTVSTASLGNPAYIVSGTLSTTDQIEYYSGDGVTVDNTALVTGEGGFQVRHWDRSEGAVGSWAYYTISGGVISVIRSGIISQGLITSGLIQ